MEEAVAACMVRMSKRPRKILTDTCGRVLGRVGVEASVLGVCARWAWE